MRYTSLRNYSTLIAVIFVLQAACAPVRPDHFAWPDKSRLGRVGLAVGGFDPTYKFEAVTGGRGEGAVKGSLEGAIQCGQGLHQGDATSVLLAIICLPVAALVGAVAGAASTESSKNISTAQTKMQSQISSLSLQERLRSALERYADDVGLALGALPSGAGPAAPGDMPAYREFSDQFDTILEVTALQLVAQTSGATGIPVFLRLKARVRVVNTHDGSVRDTFPAASTGFGRPVAQWLADDMKPVQDGIDTEIREVAETAVDEVLLIYHPGKLVSEQPSQSAGKDESGSHWQLVPAYALRPIEPPLRTKIYWGQQMTWAHLERFQLVTLDPTFSWEAFPRGFDIVVGEAPGQARKILYDFRIYDDHGIVYERNGLEVPRHHLETQLKACTRYRWTVRSRFLLNGVPRATEWTGAFNTLGGEAAPWWWRRGSKPALAVSPPNIFYYPIIETPGERGQTCPRR
jgi:hypothetical protein